MSTDIDNRVREAMVAHPEWGKERLSSYLGINRATARLAMMRVKLSGGGSETVEPKCTPGRDEVVAEMSKNEGVVTVRSCNIKTLDDALRVAKVDTKVWDVDRYVVNSWEVTMKHSPVTTGKSDPDAKEWKSVTKHKRDTYTNFQVKVWLKRSVPKDEEDAVAKIINAMGKHAPKYPVFDRPAGVGERFTYELGVFIDPHMGRRTWGRETGKDYDLDIAENILVNAAEDLLARVAHYDVEQIIIPIGNDTFEANSPDNETPKSGHQLDVDGRYPHVFERVYNCAIKIIDRCLQIAPVHIILVHGNHDPVTSYHLALILKEHYIRCPEVMVDCEPRPRKCVVYGKTFIGYTHSAGGKSDIASVFFSEFREQIARCNHVEIHVGHKHKAGETRMIATRTGPGGVRIRVLPSLTSRSAWESDMGYSPEQCAEGYLWGEKSGYYGHISVNARVE